MCSYTYYFYLCGCDSYIWDIEYCSNRLVNPHSIEMCDKPIGRCHKSEYYCSGCSEDHTLEFELQE
ncbi:hypothetical protein M433DRAFT_97994 [Acidomyces richmondensis BFW]|nr:hypothetical protein M433DRAFT_97994 [Acidomyces richmondensis BFW]